MCPVDAVNDSCNDTVITPDCTGVISYICLVHTQKNAFKLRFSVKLISFKLISFIHRYEQFVPGEPIKKFWHWNDPDVTPGFTDPVLV